MITQPAQRSVVGKPHTLSGLEPQLAPVGQQQEKAGDFGAAAFDLDHDTAGGVTSSAAGRDENE